MILSRLHSLFLLSLFVICPENAFSQLDSVLFSRDYTINPADEGELMLEVDNASFFKDNEWNGDVTTGYTLPGLWLQPKVVYTAIPELRLEAGIHTLLYSGSTKYPNTIYQDIAIWKGNQYQDGTHLMPYFRANIQLNKLHLILGNLYGGSNHRLPDPLFSSELNLTSDPEAGVQLLYDTKRMHTDVWCNWQSFIFKGDTHQESFIFGLSSQYSLLSAHYGKQTSNDPLVLTLSLLAHHRGGEIDSTATGINTLMNGSLGLTYSHNANLPWLRSWSLGTHLLGYIQQAGILWPIDKGWALYAQANATFAHGFSAKLGYQTTHNFISILSYPYYGCMSLKAQHKDATYKSPQLITARLDWSHPFRHDYAIGVRAEMFHFMPGGQLIHPDASAFPQQSSTSLSFGLFLKANLLFRLQRINKRLSP